MKLLLFALAMPMFGQPAVTCAAPTATVTWPADPAHPALYARVQPGTQVLGYLDAVKAGMVQRGPISGAGNVQFTGLLAGPYVAYLFQDSPYWQGPTVAFTCAATAPSPTPTPMPQPLAGITVILVGNAPPAGTPCNATAVLEAASGYCVATFTGVTTLRLNMGDMVVSALGFAGGTLAIQFDVLAAGQ